MTRQELAALVDQMSLDEQVSLLSGVDFWSTAPIERLQIGALNVTDGPNGARGGGGLVGNVKSAAFPCGIAIGATWNTKLAGEIGAAIAEETKSKGAQVLLGPTVNIQRSVTNGRNFECYSEDPVLTAGLASSYILKMQEQGVGATIKHFAGNESEVERTTMSSEIDERSLREIYLIPFEAAVKQAGTWAVMSGYNRLNGTFASENEWLLTKVLRNDWGFDGVVMSDWFGSHSTAETVNAGLDLEMPGPTRDRGDKLIAAVEKGKVSSDTVRERALNMLTLMDKVGALKNMSKRVERADDRPEHRALIRRAGAEAAVLLKNEDNILPLDKSSGQKIAVIGPNAKRAQIMGGGSAQLNPHYRVSPYEGLVSALGGADTLSYAFGCSNDRFLPVFTGRFEADWFANTSLEGAPVYHSVQEGGEVFHVGGEAEGKVTPGDYSMRLKSQFVPEHSGTYLFGLTAACYARAYIDGKLISDAWTDWKKGHTFFEQGCDEVVGECELEAGRSYEITLEMATKQNDDFGITAFRFGIGRPDTDAALENAVSKALDADVVLIFAGRSGEWDTEGSDLEGIVLPGRQNELISAVAEVNPKTIVILQTGGPVEMPWIDDVAGVIEAWYPGQEAGNALADVVFGDAEPSGRLPQSFPVKWSDNPTHSQDPQIYPGLDGKVRYAEGLFIGYRHYEKAGIAPLFPFGFGLGYARHEFANFVASSETFGAEESIDFHIGLRNTNNRAGSAVIQLYVRDEDSSVVRPAKELKAFSKVALDANDGRTVTLKLSPRDFAFFDVENQCWVVEPGQFEVLAGFSAQDIRASVKIVAKERICVPV